MFMDEVLFKEACDKIIGRQQGLRGIGTLGEKTVHAVLKYYYAPQEKYHEIRIGNFIADICKEGEIIEIQTRHFYTMRAKLDYFLQDYEVTIVYPIPYIKFLRWVDPETGEIHPPRKCPKKGKIYDIIPELYSIKPYLSNEHLHFILIFLNMEEYRILDGWSKDKKKGSTKTDKIPTSLVEEWRIDTQEDFLNFLPDNLPEKFTSKDVSALCKIPMQTASTLLHILNDLKLIDRIGKTGNAYLYEINI
ncbi:MAG: hypothetical protein K2K96_05360 [Lachnospiraceae bacterium]|nr:hypothetical protein [Lachnospiraceae bacterium]